MWAARRSVLFLVICLFSIPALTQAGIISSGSVTIPGTFDFDFDSGVVATVYPDPIGDIWWQVVVAGTEFVTPWNNTTIVNLGAVDFASITLAYLEGQTYGTTLIGNSSLVTGDVFAVITNQGNYAAAEVTGPIVGSNQDYGLPMQWETFAGPASSVPEPSQLPLVGAVLAAGLIAVRRGR
jgi:hypothetical protein